MELVAVLRKNVANFTGTNVRELTVLFRFLDFAVVSAAESIAKSKSSSSTLMFTSGQGALLSFLFDEVARTGDDDNDIAGGAAAAADDDNNDDDNDEDEAPTSNISSSSPYTRSRTRWPPLAATDDDVDACIDDEDDV